MIRIAWDQGFRKIYRKKVRNDALMKQKFWKAIDTFDGAKPRFLNRGKKRRSVSTLSIPRASDWGVEWVDLFSRNPFHPRLRTHKLSGKLEGLWAFTVAYDCRVVLKFLNGDEVLLVDVGGHKEVY